MRSTLALAPILVFAACPSTPTHTHDAGVVINGEGEGEGTVAGEGEGEGGGAGIVSVVADPAPGVFASTTSLQVTLTIASTSSHSLTLWYSDDGSPPVPNVAHALAGPIAIASSTQLRAVVVDENNAIVATFFGTYLFLDDDAAQFSTNLPVLVFWSTSDVPQQKDDIYAEFTLLVYEPNAGERVQFPSSAKESSRASIKIHGSTTADYPKHPWRVKLRNAVDDGQHDVALLGMPSDANWILGAPLDFDRALMRTTLAYEISRAIGRYAPRTQHAEVFIAGNGTAVGMKDYIGVYEVTEHIERAPQRIDIQALTHGDTLAPAVTGGYIIKQDRAGPGDIGFTAGDAGGAFSWTGPFFYVEPQQEDVVAQQDAFITAYFNDAAAALAAPDHTSPSSGLTYDQLIDVDSFIDHHIVNVFTKNPDAFRLSGFYNKDRNGLLNAGPVWDFDRTMGCASDGRADDPTWWDATNVTTDTTAMFDFGFYRGLFNDPAFTARYWARMNELIDGPLSPDALDPFLDANAANLEEASARNFAKWTDYPPRGTFDDEVTLLKQWVNARHDWIKQCLALPDPRTCTGN